MAGPRSDARALPPPLDRVGDLLRLLVGRRDGDPALERRRAVDLDDAEAVEAGGEARPAVEPCERAPDLLDVDPADLASTKRVTR